MPILIKFSIHILLLWNFKAFQIWSLNNWTFMNEWYVLRKFWCPHRTKKVVEDYKNIHDFHYNIFLIFPGRFRILQIKIHGLFSRRLAQYFFKCNKSFFIIVTWRGRHTAENLVPRDVLRNFSRWKLSRTLTIYPTFLAEIVALNALPVMEAFLSRHWTDSLRKSGIQHGSTSQS